jgi:hypothetical protein
LKKKLKIRKQPSHLYPDLKAHQPKLQCSSSKIISSKSKNIVKKNTKYLGIFYVLKWNFQKQLINYSTDLCWRFRVRV